MSLRKTPHLHRLQLFPRRTPAEETNELIAGVEIPIDSLGGASQPSSVVQRG